MSIHPRDYHDWELVLPVGDIGYAKCRDCRMRLTPEEAARNIRWQDRELARRRELTRELTEPE